MGELINSCRSYVGIVEKYIGSAYDVVKYVGDNLDVIQKAAASVQDYNDRYLGPVDTPPITRLDGTPLQPGDMYFNPTNGNTYVYYEGAWVGLGDVVTTTEIVTVTAEHIVGSDTIISLTNPYPVNKNALLVFVGSVYQYGINTDPSGSYVETDANTITFPGIQLQEGEVVSVIAGESVNSLNPNISVSTSRYVSVLGGETAITIPDGIIYAPNSGSLQVYIDGLMAYSGVEYYETNTTTITLANPATAGQVFTFKAGVLATTVPANTSGVTLFNIAAEFYSSRATLNTNDVVVIKGRSSASDGGEGVFTYNPNIAKASANGGTIIDSSVALGSQGTGLGSGCWIRVYHTELHSEWFGDVGRSVANLKNVTPSTGDTFITQGFYPDSNLGGGTFYWDASVGKAEHNGGTVISPSVTATPGTATWYDAPTVGPDGCWVREVEGLDVTWFGATLDAVTDYTNAFNGAKEVGVAKVPVGTYEISGAVTGSFYSFGAVTINTGSVTTIKNLMV